MTQKQQARNLANRMNALKPLLVQMEKELGEAELGEMNLGTLRVCPDAYVLRWLLKFMIDHDIFSGASNQVFKAITSEERPDPETIQAIDQNYQVWQRRLKTMVRRTGTMQKSTKERLTVTYEENNPKPLNRLAQ